uniref:Uncharacterized protein n=1 Tax=Chromera velia CCMP2878 TaxID=1169474 RepID=A0A0G4GQY5_9ALVE|mmetsp:Transcript_55133/g.107838  ORF Transcript_55133/g.107838 Transcript_55133/m.107838 type:complete len:192 (+) Transcript_55133:130-705(+)|eukprot:Cvel_22982.t1-p1 / transcript=Cvel_22982.t1 / gene=Cvel_22982 / organism=Chromera_velia_CCMP2878 / gene_product=hypothetical protein / transcript_product=hypothetical protein / location=Cvel_scaffold2317:27016-27699(-) / protein_length=191 / sequence_SO=supercontig / SO=protein_coding / is_pseudo=false
MFSADISLDLPAGSTWEVDVTWTNGRETKTWTDSGVGSADLALNLDQRTGRLEAPPTYRTYAPIDTASKLTKPRDPPMLGSPSLISTAVPNTPYAGATHTGMMSPPRSRLLREEAPLYSAPALGGQDYPVQCAYHAYGGPRGEIPVDAATRRYHVHGHQHPSRAPATDCCVEASVKLSCSRPSTILSPYWY